MKKPVNLLIVIEALVLAAVIVLCLFSSATSGITGLLGGIGSSDTTASGDGSEDNALGASGDAASGNASGAEGAADTRSAQEETEASQTSANDTDDTYDTLRLTFSDEVEELLTSLTTEQLVAILFITTPEELTGVDAVTIAGDGTSAALTSYPVSGLVYSAQNFASTEQAQDLLNGTQEYSQDSIELDLFLIVEELGGEDASPVATSCGFEVQRSPSSLAETGSTSDVKEAAQNRADYLTDVGINAVLGPIADAATGEDDAFDTLTYGDSALNAADYVAADVSALEGAGVISILQAFPGVKEAADDYSAYQAAIDAGVSMIQVSSVGDSVLSADTTRTLRDEMGFDGVIVTDDLSEQDDVGSAAVTALKAGMNLLYVTDGFEEAYDAVLAAVESGELTQTVFMNAAGRVLTARGAL